MRYLLDTNICIYISHRHPEAVGQRFDSLRAWDAGMSVITYGELAFGAAKSQRPAANLANLRDLERKVPVIPLNERAGLIFGELRAGLERVGRPIGAYDMWIAAHALSLDVILVTNNTREYARVPGLRIENWAV